MTAVVSDNLVKFPEPDTISGLAILEMLATTDLKDDTLFQETLKARHDSLDYDQQEAVLGCYDVYDGRDTYAGFLEATITALGGYELRVARMITSGSTVVVVPRLRRRLNSPVRAG